MEIPRTSTRSLMERIDAFQAKRPEITIAAPWATFSRLWEVSTADGTSQWDNGVRMMNSLEERYR